MESNHKICRACLTTKESFNYNLFDNVDSEMFSFCTSIEISKEDGLPKTVCTVCYELLVKFFEFKHTCMKSQTLLSNCNDIKNEPTDLCITLNTTADTVKEEYNNDNDSIDACDDYEEIDIKKCSNGIKKESSETKSKPRQYLTKRPLIYACTLCNKKFRVLERFESHKLEHEGKNVSISCGSCNKTFLTWSGLKKHKEGSHSIGGEELKCLTCNKLYKNLSTLKTHMYTHTDKKLLVCDICGVSMRSTVMKAHLERHDTNRKREFSCEHCGKKFYTNSSLRSHMSRRHAGRRYICHVCSYPFTTKYNLAKHLFIHQGIKPYKCEICQKQYSTQSSLVEHKRIHSGEKPFSCTLCKRDFISKKRLRDHFLTHTGERPHKCGVCILAFTQRGTLKRHMRIHENNPVVTT